MVETKFTTKYFFILVIFLVGGFNQTFAQSSDQDKTTKEAKIKVLGDPGEGMFFVQYNLPRDAKKVIWTVTDEKGEVLVKEKFKNIKAGKNRFQYNYLNGPDGRHKFKIVADEEQIGEIEVLKEKK